MVGVPVYFRARAAKVTLSRGTLALIALSIALTGGCVALALRSGALQDAARSLFAAGPAVWSACLALMVGVAALRFVRLRIALSEAAFVDVFTASAAHGSAAALAPGKLGELALPFLVRRLSGSPLIAGAGLLVLHRLMDFVVLLALGGFAFALLAGTPLAAAPVLVGAAATPLALQRLLGLLDGRRGKIAELLSSAAKIAARLSLARLYATFAMTALIWATLWTGAFVAAEGAGIDRPFAAAGVALAAASAAFASPVNGVANAGPFEAAFAGAYVAAGASIAPALAAAALTHACAILAPLMCLAAGVVLSALRRYDPLAGVSR